MKYDDKIMLDVFEKFLGNPQRLISSIGDLAGANTIDAFCPPGLSSDQSIIRWHVIMFLSEFVLDPQLVSAYGTYGLVLEGTDYLNRSGQQFYADLKTHAQKE